MLRSISSEFGSKKITCLSQNHSMRHSMRPLFHAFGCDISSFSPHDLPSFSPHDATTCGKHELQILANIVAGQRLSAQRVQSSAAQNAVQQLHRKRRKNNHVEGCEQGSFRQGA